MGTVAPGTSSDGLRSSLARSVMPLGGGRLGPRFAASSMVRGRWWRAAQSRPHGYVADYVLHSRERTLAGRGTGKPVGRRSEIAPVIEPGRTTNSHTVGRPRRLLRGRTAANHRSDN